MSRTARSSHVIQRFLLSVAWIFVVCLVTLVISWRDVGRIVSGLLYFESERITQPVPDLQRSVKLLSYAESVDQDAAFVHNQEGLLWYQRNDLQNAMSAFTQAVTIDQTDGSGLNNLAVTYFNFGQIQQAAASQKRAAQNAPNNAITHYNLGIVLMKQNVYGEAIHEFREATIIDPGWVLPYLQQGFDYLQLQDYANAEKAATAAIKLGANQQSAYVILAISLYNQGRDEDALKSIDGALYLEPSDRVAGFYKALILKRLGEFDPALEILDRLLMSTNDQGQISRINSEIESIRRILQDRQIGAQ
jgi:tetratricopeptide (TPR) repeat protein